MDSFSHTLVGKVIHRLCTTLWIVHHFSVFFGCPQFPQPVDNSVHYISPTARIIEYYAGYRRITPRFRTGVRAKMKNYTHVTIHNVDNLCGLLDPLCTTPSYPPAPVDNQPDHFSQNLV